MESCAITTCNFFYKTSATNVLLQSKSATRTPITLLADTLLSFRDNFISLPWWKCLVAPQFLTKIFMRSNWGARIKPNQTLPPWIQSNRNNFRRMTTVSRMKWWNEDHLCEHKSGWCQAFRFRDSLDTQKQLGKISAVIGRTRREKTEWSFNLK